MSKTFVICILVMLCSAAIVAAGINDGLIVYYDFDEANGTVAYDSAGSRDASLENGAAWTTGKEGSAVSFDGANDYVDAGTDSLGVSSAITVSAWVTRAGSGSDATTGIVERGNYMYPFWLDMVGQSVKNGVRTSGTNYIQNPDDITDNAWHHLAFTYNGSYQALYVDGNEVDSDSNSGTLDDRSGKLLTIGRTAGGSGYFNGKIDEVRIYERALSTDEISELYSGNQTGNQTEDTTPPSVPYLTIGAVTDTSIELLWSTSSDPESGVVEYNIYQNGGLYGSTIGTTVFRTHLNPSTLYYFEISAVNGDGYESAKSNIANATTHAAPATPPIISNIASQEGATYAIITWDTNEASTTAVEYGLTPAYGSITQGNNSLVTSHIDMVFGLNNSTSYHYRVISTDAANNTAYSTGQNFTTLSSGEDTTPPSVPSNLTALTVSETAINLGWTPSVDAESGVDHYIVYRDSIDLVHTSATSYLDSNLTPGINYTYEVSAVNGDGYESAKSTAIVVFIEEAEDTTPPSIPYLMVGEITDTSIGLIWNASSDPESGVAAYKVYKNSVLYDITVATTSTVTSLDPETTYTFEVTAVNGDGYESAKSSAVNATTDGQEEEAGLIAYWNFDESNGTVAYDNAGNRDATVMNGATRGAGKSGKG